MLRSAFFIVLAFKMSFREISKKNKPDSNSKIFKVSFENFSVEVF